MTEVIRSHMDAFDHPRLPLLLAGVLLAIVVTGIVDLVLDNPEAWISPHVAFEVLLIIVSLGLAIYLWRGWMRASRTLAETRAALAKRKVERDAWHQRARGFLDGLGEEIDRQFQTWGLTPSESQVALLLIKGLSHKEIAAATGRSERTARQHAVAAYRKAQVSGRAELAGFFLEDLMLPRDGGD